MSKQPAYLHNLTVGQRVLHWKFGCGQVLGIRRGDGKERARVNFGPGGVHELSVGLARLTDPDATLALGWHPAWLRSLTPGRRVHHWQYGFGQVLDTRLVDGEEIAQIDFGREGVIEISVLMAGLTDPDAAPSERLRAAWEDLMDESAPLQALGPEPWLAWFGSALLADKAALTSALNDAFGDLGLYPVGRLGGAEVGWPEVTVLIHPASARREKMVLAGVLVLSVQEGRRPYVFLPYYQDWNQVHEVTPRRIRVGEDKVQALVEADLHLGEATLPIAFALPTFDLGRHSLHRDTRVAVALTALAFACGPSPSPAIQVRHEPAMIEDLRRAGFELGSGPDGTTTYHMEGMSAWLPDAERPDLVEFRGRVVAAQKIALPPRGRPAWKLLLRAWRDGDADWLLDVVFETSVWAADHEPAVGSDVEGLCWLQGECLGLTMPRKPR